MNLSEGQVIQANFLPGPARVKKFEQRNAFCRLEVVLERSGEYRSLRLPLDQLAQIQVVHHDPLALSSDPEEFFLLIEANRIRLAHQFDPLLAVSVSQVDPLPHQIEAVYHYALDTPRLRFLIADDPGAGKTIMAGLVLKEMQQRGLVRRVLIVAPGHLKYQWQREMKEKFSTTFRLIDRNAFRAAWGENVWEEHPLAITSIDFLKQDDIKATLTGDRWDLVMVDEAHKMSAYAYETRERVKIDKTKRYQVGEVLSRQSEHLLFLTATPHRGDEENFRLFLDLLRPGFFAKAELLRESVERKENPLFVRRLKEDMKTFDGRPIFPPRHVKTVTFKMTEPEVQLYNAVTSYVRNYFDQARENRNIAFAMVILQRRLTSSVHAILSSLQRRRDRLEELLRLPEKIRSDERYDALRTMTEDEIEDLPEEERWEIERRLEHLTIAQNIDDVRAEIEQLDGLIAQAEEVRAQEIESKLVKLRDEVLDNLGGRKLLIFTEHKDTLWYLQEKLQAWGYRVNVIHGGLDLDARIEAERVFKHETQIMVATEAAGEGINLQFCSLMVNYDIPWNPNRLEQRMGRIHRYGQDREVFIWNLVSKDTREGQILGRLFVKLDRIRAALGTDRVFDIIGDVIPGTNLSDLLKDAIFNQR
ncbi:MAG: DEAD/DEAH box helicase, partial [Candidatus Binatia bacterium]